jgi:hypothetical protein
MNRISLVISVVCLFPMLTSAQQGKAAAGREFTVLWDRTDGYTSCDPDTGHFSGLGRELLDMGATIKNLWPGQVYSDDTLTNIDVVIICLRYDHMGSSQQTALVRYVRNGGSLLILCKYDESVSAMNPIIVNFGMVITGDISKAEHLNVFTGPATTRRRPVKDALITEGRTIDVGNGAYPIVGYNPANNNVMQDCLFALGRQSGKGRFIAAGCTNQWLSKSAPCGIPYWGYAHNTKLFDNIIEYLLGYSDLKAGKLKCKKSLTAGKNVTLKAKIQNLEYCYNREVSLGFYLSSDKQYDEGADFLLGITSIPPIPGKRQKLVKMKVYIPEDAAAGQYCFLARINPPGDPLEINTANNLSAKKVRLN